MKFSLIVCTYKRSQELLRLLTSIQAQTLYPNEIIIIDGSPDEDTKGMLAENTFENLIYKAVAPNQRGLTKQRNIGIASASETSEVLFFFDDDVVAEPDYFQKIFEAYNSHPDAVGIGGYITNEVKWVHQTGAKSSEIFRFDGWQRDEPLRFKIRKLFALDSNVPPGFSPLFSHGRSVAFLPPSGRIYPAEQLMGGVSSFKRQVFEKFQFSTFFEGYGLYEDADFCIRVARSGNLYVNTAARVAHYHAASGRPNQYQYGKMVVRNGWYVWRVKNPDPMFGDKIKWHGITILLTILRFFNTFTTPQKWQALTETLGRTAGWLSIFFKAPKIKKQD